MQIMRSCINFLINDCVLVLLLYPLAAVQMWHQAEFGKAPYAANGGDEIEIGMRNPAIRAAEDNNDLAEKDPPPPAYESTKI